MFKRLKLNFISAHKKKNVYVLGTSLRHKLIKPVFKCQVLIFKRTISIKRN